TATFFLLDKATNPSNRQKEWDYITRFCNQINKELEGITDRLSEQVKTKVIELLYSWSVVLPDEAKIIEAYQLLKKQDSFITNRNIDFYRNITYFISTLIPSPKHTNPVFDNEEKTKNFLKVKIIEVLQEAKRIIKNMDVAVQQEVSHRVSILEEVNNSVTLLNEMRSHFKRDESTQEGKELLNVRHLIFRCGLDVVTATDDDDSALGDILHASDDLSRVINSYKRIVGGQTIMIDLPGSTASECTTDRTSPEILINLADLDSGTPSPLKNVLTSPQHSDSLPADLLTLTPLVGAYNQWISSQVRIQELIDLLCSSAPLNPVISTQSCKDFAMLNLDKASPVILCLDSSELRAAEENIHPALTAFCLPAGITPVPSALTSAKPRSFALDSPLFRSLSPTLPTSQSPSGSDISLTSVFVPLEAIKPTPVLVRNVVLQAAVPKVRVLSNCLCAYVIQFINLMIVKCIYLFILFYFFDFFFQEKVRMRYKLTFILGDRQVTESEEIDKFPPVERWGYL
uniref:Golgi associated, gamma adaptin ear containing, ARF binding protein 3a n=1 Tax=Cyprinus carpio TaxID=7962 RepID=A0A8C1P234_CYPCA